MSCFSRITASSYNIPGVENVDDRYIFLRKNVHFGYMVPCLVLDHVPVVYISLIGDVATRKH